MKPAGDRSADGRSRLEEVFTAALDTPGAERRSFVAVACAGDSALEIRVLRLLAAHETTSGPLDLPLSIMVASLLAEDETAHGEATTAAASAGSMIGPYKIARLIGRGGMGSVYLAERADGAFEQRVALKVINAGIVTAELERRFLRERQILARLDHPGIARLLHGGLTPQGHPYLAMEFVEGEPITEWVAARRLEVRERLRLFLQVCDAVHYAHGQLVVHRDLKPSNIIVTPDGRARLLDFGIARLLADGDDDLSTRTGFLLLTPEYAAPELLHGEAVTMSTDVYALGVVLYEMLTGHRPFPSDSRSLADLLRLAEREPSPPSRAPGVEPTRRRQLEGDIDAVIGMALRREPERRYASVAAFADDVRAYLDRRPVVARPAARAYRVRRFVQRHAVGVVATTALMTSILAGLAGTTRMATAARQEAVRSDAVRAFLFSLWEAADPDRHGGDVPTALDLVNTGASRVDSLGAAAGPEVRVDMLVTLGFLYGKLGEYDRAVGMFERGAQEARQEFGTHELTGGALDGLAQNLIEAGRFDEAETAIRESIAIRKAASSPDTALAASYSTLGVLLSTVSRYEEAREVHQAALELDRRAAGPRSAAVATDLSNLGAVAQHIGEYDEAERYHREALAIRREQFGDRPHPDLATSLGHLAAVLRDVGVLEKAESLQHEALAVRHAVLGPDHPDVAISLEQIALTLEAAGRYDAADSLASEALELRVRILGERHPATVASMNNLATVRFRRGDYAWAAEVQERVAEAWRADLGLTDGRTLTAIHNLGVMRLRAGDLAAAERYLAEALDARRRVLGERHPTVAQSLRWLSELRRVQGRVGEAESLGRDALAIFEEAYPPRHPRIAEATLCVGAALVEAGRPREAVGMLRSVLAIRTQAYPEASPEIGEAHAWLGTALARAGDREDGRNHLHAAVQTYEAADRSGESPAVLARQELDRLR